MNFPFRRKNGLLLLLTNTRSGSTYLYDTIRTIPNIKIRRDYGNMNLLGLSGGRYPKDLCISKSRLRIENFPHNYVYIPSLNKFHLPDTKRLNNYELEKIHPHYYGCNSVLFNERINILRNNREVKLIILVRKPEDSLLSFINYKKRNPLWAEGKTMPQFLLNQYKSIFELTNISSTFVITYNELIQNTASVFHNIFDQIWHYDLASDKLINFISNANEFLDRKKRLKTNSSFLGNNIADKDRVILKYQDSILVMNDYYNNILKNSVKDKHNV